MVESSSEAHFFLIAPKKRIQKYYSIYNTTLDVSSILGKLAIAITLVFLSFRYSFLIVGLFFLAIAFLATKVKEISGTKVK